MQNIEITDFKNSSKNKDYVDVKESSKNFNEDSNFKSFKNKGFEERRIQRYERRKQRDYNLNFHKEKILMIKSKIQAKELQILKSLTRFDFDVDKTIEDLSQFNFKKLDKKEKRLNKDSELFNLHFPGEQFDIDKFRIAKKDFKNKRREQRISERNKYSSGIKENNYYKETYGNKIQKENNKSILFENKTESTKEIEKKIANNEISYLYLDGNNMLFVDGSIRNDCLNKKRNNGELKLSNLVFEFMKKTNTTGCLVFDRTNQVFNKESDGVFLKVISAYPEFESSDDAFKVWAGGLDATKLNSSLFVTSDRELKEKLIEKGVGFVLKSGEFFHLLKNTLNEDYQKILNMNN